MRSSDGDSADPVDLAGLYNADEFEALARERLPPPVYAIIAGGAGSGAAVLRNRAAFERWCVVPRALVDVSRIDPSTTVLSRPIAFPLLFAPSALHRLVHPEGEVATARAANSIDTIMIVSIGASLSIETIGAAAQAPWLQLYWYDDPGLVRSLVERAEAAGYSAICLTVDAAVRGRRERQFAGPLPADVTAVDLPDPEPPMDATLSWATLDRVRAITRLPIVLKGIMAPQDGLRAVDAGVAAIVVSNHGGRLLDAAPATLDMLPRVAEAVDGRLEILLDGGVRRGGDIVRALALGARAVMIGRPVMWGLHAGGTAGVLRLVEGIRAEFISTLGLAGLTSVGDITRDVLVRDE